MGSETPALSTDPFSTWLDQLEAIMRSWHEKHGNLPYALPLVRDPKCEAVISWRDSYDDGMTPQQAFESDQSYWEE
jgi:hypothetical protein